jgi:hypothetical protein
MRAEPSAVLGKVSFQDAKQARIAAGTIFQAILEIALIREEPICLYFRQHRRSRKVPPILK